MILKFMWPTSMKKGNKECSFMLNLRRDVYWRHFLVNALAEDHSKWSLLQENICVVPSQQFDTYVSKAPDQFLSSSLTRLEVSKTPVWATKLPLCGTGSNGRSSLQLLLESKEIVRHCGGYLYPPAPSILELNFRIKTTF